jgi:hypothetical protein
MNQFFFISLIWTYILFISRPSEQDLFEQWKTIHELQPWPVQLLQTTLKTSPLDKLPGALNTALVSDYMLITVVWKEKRQEILIGIFARFVPLSKQFFTWTKEDDVLLAIALHCLSFFLYSFIPRLANQIHRPQLRYPWTFLLTSFSTYSFLSLITSVVMLINVGQPLRNSMDSSMTFWLLYSVCPAMASIINHVILDRYPSAIGGVGGTLGLAAYGVLRTPNFRFSLYTMKLGCFGLFIFEAILHISVNAFRSPVSLVFEVFLIGTLSVMLYRVNYPREVFTLETILNLTFRSIYAK